MTKKQQMLYIEEDLINEFKAACALKNKKISTEIEEILTEYLIDFRGEREQFEKEKAVKKEREENIRANEKLPDERKVPYIIPPWAISDTLYPWGKNDELAMANVEIERKKRLENGTLSNDYI